MLVTAAKWSLGHDHKRRLGLMTTPMPKAVLQTGAQTMKAPALAFVTLLAFAPAAISTAHAGPHARTGSAFDIAQQYAKGGKFGGVSSGTTGSTLEVAQDSMNFLGTPDRTAANWSMLPIVAKGE
jgi:ABC-type enterobactin transport system permease subunit